MKQTDLKYEDLSFENKMALLEYSYMSCGNLNEVEQFYKNRHFTYEIISVNEAKKRCMEYPFDAGDFNSFEEYHQWYIGGGCIPNHGDSMYPVIEGGDDEWLDDGWHRFHSYVKHHKKEIPILSIQ